MALMAGIYHWFCEQLKFKIVDVTFVSYFYCFCEHLEAKMADAATLVNYMLLTIVFVSILD